MSINLIAEIQGREGFLHFDQLHDVQEVSAVLVEAPQEFVEVLGLNLEGVPIRRIVIIPGMNYYLQIITSHK